MKVTGLPHTSANQLSWLRVWSKGMQFQYILYMIYYVVWCTCRRHRYFERPRTGAHSGKAFVFLKQYEYMSVCE